MNSSQRGSVMASLKFASSLKPISHLDWGNNLAMVQLKIIFCHIISKFTFSLSPKHWHSPVYRMIVKPEN
ncbi:hypothetical protein QQP08_004463, partial [Theobroma cacao]